MTKSIDIQGHRGCRGLMPENTLPAFLKALELGVTTLELDLAVSKDHQLVVSHEPYFRAAISLGPLGQEILKEDELNHNIYKMDYSEVRKYDVGSKSDPRFPQKETISTYRPLLSEVIKLAKTYASKHKSEVPYFNVEIKKDQESDGIFHPNAEVFSRLLLDLIEESGIKDKFIIQSFDLEALQVTKTKDSTIPLALLIESDPDFKKNIAELGFKPDIYSCYFKLVTTELINYCHQSSIKVIPWTVNEIEDIKNMVELGVDGIISDYPDRVISVVN